MEIWLTSVTVVRAGMREAGTIPPALRLGTRRVAPEPSAEEAAAAAARRERARVARRARTARTAPTS